MLYLEDFLELIENLPSELRDRFTDIRTLDLEVQNGLDVAEKSVEEFFKNLQNMAPNQIHSSFERIKEDYRKILENADEKVNLATMMHDLVKRYLARLDQEVAKFKIELEADSPGITEALERKVKESEQIQRFPRRERTRKRKRLSPLTNGDRSVDFSTNFGGAMVNGNVPQIYANHNKLGAKPFSGETGSDIHANPSNLKKSQTVSYRLIETNRGMSVGSSRSESREKAVQSNVANVPGASSTTAGIYHLYTEQLETRHGRTRKLTSRVSEMLRDVIQKQEQRERLGSASDATAGTSTSSAPSTSAHQYHHHHHHHHHHHNQQQQQNYQQQHSPCGGQCYGTSGSGGEAPYDDSDQDFANNEAAELSDQSDQQRWCICNRVSFGAMVACDDKDCPFEWFHYECVGITQPPKGKWFCPHCTKRRK